MNTIRLAFLLLLIGTIAGSSRAEQANDTPIHPLHAKRHEVLGMSGILRDLASEAGDRRNGSIAREMHHAAERCAEYLDAAEAFLKLYESMQDPTDRLRATFALQLRLLIYIEALQARIREVTSGLANASGDTSKPGIPSAGIRLLERMAEAKDLLKNLEGEARSRLNAIGKP